MSQVTEPAAEALGGRKLLANGVGVLVGVADGTGVSVGVPTGVSVAVGVSVGVPDGGVYATQTRI